MKSRPKEWGLVIYRVPTRLTPGEREFTRNCTRTHPPSTSRHKCHPPTAPRMLRCLIDGGTCRHSIVNQRNPKAAIFTHFNLHHKDGAFYDVKIEKGRDNFIRTKYPVPLPPWGCTRGMNLHRSGGRNPRPSYHRKQKQGPRANRRETIYRKEAAT